MDNYLSGLPFSTALCIGVLLLFLAPGAQAEVNDAYQTKAYRTYQSIEIDGELSEEDWQNAEPITEFAQIEPYEGEPLTEPMEARILYDNENIYFGFTCYDSDMSQLIANEMRRDARDIHENDNVFLLLDTYNDKRSGFFFRMNALGAVQDRAVTNSGDTFNSDWDAIVACKAKIHDGYWTLEFSIPFSQLALISANRWYGGSTWGASSTKSGGIHLGTGSRLLRRLSEVSDSKRRFACRFGGYRTLAAPGGAAVCVTWPHAGERRWRRAGDNARIQGWI